MKNSCPTVALVAFQAVVQDVMARQALPVKCAVLHQILGGRDDTGHVR